MWGATYFTSNYDELYMTQTNPNFNIVIIDDDRRRYEVIEPSTGKYRLPDRVSFMSVLLPPYEAMSAYIDGRILDSENIYSQYLYADYVVAQCLSAILTAVFHGKQLLFFIPADEDIAFEFSRILFGYIQSAYGLRIGRLGIPQSGIPMPTVYQMGAMIELMYDMNNANFDEFVINFPEGLIPSGFTIDKIYREGNLNETIIRRLLELPEYVYITPEHIPQAIVVYIRKAREVAYKKLQNRSNQLESPFVQLGAQSK
jgi:hypothetical protein